MSNKEQQKQPLLEWESFPMMENPKTTVILVSFILVVLGILWIITVKVWETPFFYVLGFLFLIVPLLPYFILTKYQFYEFTIKISYLFIKAERRYSDFGCYYVDKKGVMLSTFKMPRWLDSYRGQSLRFSKDQKEKELLLKILEEKIGKRY